MTVVGKVYEKERLRYCYENWLEIYQEILCHLFVFILSSGNGSIAMFSSLQVDFTGGLYVCWNLPQGKVSVY